MPVKKVRKKRKRTGTKRSKIEVWLEQELSARYPSLVIYYNKKDAIGSELDIYIPELSLAFEINGIFHYRPIFGKEKLLSIRENDKRKSLACEESGIELWSINISSLKSFSKVKAKKYLLMLVKVIDQNIVKDSPSV